MINKEDIFVLGNLSRLNVSPEEADRLSSDLEKILGYVSVIEKAGVDKITPEIKNLAREDAVLVFDDSKKVLDSSAGSDGKYIRVRKVLPE